jgi:hypothetical protein
MTKIPQDIIPLIGALKSTQQSLPMVPRWKKYFEREQGIREQNTLQHSHALTLIGAIAIQRMGLDGEVDAGFLLAALAIHDVGEGELGYDTLYIDKDASQDLKEYLAFAHRYQAVPEFGHLQELFLLQFALKNPENFPVDARNVMMKLAEHYRLEALVFEALERWDYLLFALEQYLDRENELVLTQVLRHQVPHFERLLVELPTFEQLWTPELAAFSARFLAERAGKWIERKGE